MNRVQYDADNHCSTVADYLNVLVEAGADVNEIYFNSNVTTLTAAVKSSNGYCMKALIAAGTSVNKRYAFHSPVRS